MTTPGRRDAVLALVVGLLASLLLAVAPAPAQAAPAPAAAPRGDVRGQITGPQRSLPKLKMLWFTKDWTYLGQRTVRGDIYSLRLSPGTYRLQFVDQRPAYDVTKYAPADVTVRVRAGRVKQKNVRLKRGAAITGVAKAGGRRAPGARVVAANTGEQSFETKANRKGQFAIGGLPTGKYSVFTYDKRRTWVGKSRWVGKLVRGKSRHVTTDLRKRGGSLLVDLFAGGRRVKGSFFVTAVSRASGQWWTARAKRGKVSFSGLFPGRYTLVAPGVGNHLARTGPIKGARVRSGRADLASRFVWKRRGATVTGTVVDREDITYPLAGASVTLYDRSGRPVGGPVTTGRDGSFEFAGQLTTQRGLTVVAGPGPYSPYLGKTTHYCKFGTVRVGGIAVRTSRVTDVGEVLLPHLPADEQDDVARCAPTP